MALRMRLARGGRKKCPFYRIVVAEASSARDGRFCERIGSYNPMVDATDPAHVVLDTARAQHWLSVGAQPSDRVKRFLIKANLLPAEPLRETPLRSAPGEKMKQRMAQKAAASEEKNSGEEEA